MFQGVVATTKEHMLRGLNKVKSLTLYMLHASRVIPIKIVTCDRRQLSTDNSRNNLCTGLRRFLKLHLYFCRFFNYIKKTSYRTAGTVAKY